ncbi:MAG: aspartate/glutamate racemase family protein [Paracoccus sp. (in: a-proteobacteria)]|uniref:aspartate/glutamate racemase family protein n=1 Tax=Paracoccus sp. TaxID=267 RepID=UPI0026DF44E4|nr:aspartate/glutamate racemase family protein [Paracoccus sp. (in: a-proteobacteria)]MDO5621348.1 aspartate/glutamate racemase family protein [Paracoccus sp. (in: a-proteobacteria)]
MVQTIGILGGMSAASTLTYYRTLCDLTRQRLGGLHSPQLLIRSLDFAPIAAMQAVDDWSAAAAILNREAHALQAGGADILLLATNTMHKLAAQMMAGVTIPLLHIADATAARIAHAGLRRALPDGNCLYDGTGFLPRPFAPCGADPHSARRHVAGQDSPYHL